MTGWQAILNQATSFTVLAGVIVWIVTSITKFITTKNIEKYKIEINQKYERELEIIKAQLITVSSNHSFAFEKVYEKKIEIFHQIYMHLYEIKISASQLVNFFEYEHWPTKSERFITFSEKYNLFIEFFSKNRLFLEQNISIKIDELISSIRDKIIDFQIYVVKKEGKGPLDRKGMESWDESAKFIQDQVPKIVTEIEIDFQRILKIIENN